MLMTAGCNESATPWSHRVKVLGIPLSKCMEVGWFLLALALFIVLGPFAAPVALVAALSANREQRGYRLPEPENN